LNFEGIAWLTSAVVRDIHDEILDSSENPVYGENQQYPIDAVLGRVQSLVSFQQVDCDVLQIAARYAVSISRGHCFADGNKRTATLAMDTFLDVHGYHIVTDDDDRKLADLMIQAASGHIDEGGLYNGVFNYLVEKAIPDC